MQRRIHAFELRGKADAHSNHDPRMLRCLEMITLPTLSSYILVLAVFLVVSAATVDLDDVEDVVVKSYCCSRIDIVAAVLALGLLRFCCSAQF